MKTTFAKVYLAAGLMILGGYFYVESRGVIFGGTDSKYSASAGGPGRPTGGWFWFSGGHGGK